MTQLIDYAELVHMIARALTSKPDAIDVAMATVEGVHTIQLTVADGDKGHVIGRNGATARAIRVILGAAAMRDKTKIRLNII